MNKMSEKYEDKEIVKTKSKGGLFSIKNILIVTSIVFVLLVVSFVITKKIMGPIIIVLLVLIIVAAYYSMYVYFAPRNLFFSGIREGTAKMIMVGTKENPKFVRAAISYKGFTFDENWNVILESKRKKWQSFIEYIEHILPGLIFVGVPGINWIWEYDFSWSSMTQDEKIKDKKELLDYIYVKKDIYVAKLKGAEVGESMVPVDIILLLTIEVINPYIALFQVEKWLEIVINRIKVPIRDYISDQDDPRILIRQKKALGDLFFNKLKESKDLEYFEEKVGVRVSKIETYDIDLGEWQETATKQWKATQEGEAEVIKQTKLGQAYVAYRERQKTADMDYLSGVYSEIMEFGDKGLVMRFLDSLTDAAKGPSNTIIPFGFVQDIAKQILGTKSPGVAEIIKETLGEDITKEDIKKFKEFIKNIGEIK
jgi:hypothetical protein